MVVEGLLKLAAGLNKVAREGVSCSDRNQHSHLAEIFHVKTNSCVHRHSPIHIFSSTSLGFQIFTQELSLEKINSPQVFYQSLIFSEYFLALKLYHR